MLGLNEVLADALNSDESFEYEENGADFEKSDDSYESVNSVEERVSAGMAYLDLTYPNHVERVDLDLLDLSMSDRCVIGQIHDFPFWLTFEGRTKSTPWLVEHGFFTPNSDEYDELTNEWLKQYNARKV